MLCLNRFNRISSLYLKMLQEVGLGVFCCLSAELVVQDDCLQALPRLSDVYFDMLLVNTAIMTFYAGSCYVNKPVILYRQCSGIC